MNVIEMMQKAAFEKIIAQGPAMMESFLANIPPDVKETIRQVGQIAVSLKSQLDRIENQQRLIMAHFDIATEAETKEIPNANGRQSERRNGGL